MWERGRYRPGEPIRWSATVVVLLLSLVGTSALAGPGAVQFVVPISGSSPFTDGCPQGAPFGEGFEDSETEPTAAVNPANPRNIVAAWIQDGGKSNVVGASHDGGATWTTALVPGISVCTGGIASRAADPWIAIGPDGVAYLASLSIIYDLPGDRPSRTVLSVNRSTDGGLTWSNPSVISAGAVLFHDKPTITADPVRPGTAYLRWTERTSLPVPTPVAPTLFVKTTDGGQTWSLPSLIYVPPGGQAWGGRLLVLPGGALLSVFTVLRVDPFPHLLVAVRSENGGLTWSPVATTIAEIPAPGLTAECPIQDPETGECVFAPEFAIDAGVGPDGRTYVTWRHPLALDQAEIRFAGSADGGRTWSSPARVGGGSAQGFLPSLAVASDNTVGVTYYDLRNDVAGDAPLTGDVWFSHSHNGGIDWEESHVAGPFDLRRAPFRLVPGPGYFVGDYHALTAIPGGFGAVFAQPAPQAVVGATDVFFASLATAG